VTIFECTARRPELGIGQRLQIRTRCEGICRYEEPLPRSLREEIDEKYQLDPEQYQYTGCLDEGVLQEVQLGIVQARNAAALNRNLFEGRAPNLDTDAVTDAASETE